MNFCREYAIAPDHPLNGTYKFVFVNSFLKLENYQVLAWYGFKRILSGTATLTENSNGTLTMKIDGTAEGKTAVKLELTYKFF